MGLGPSGDWEGTNLKNTRSETTRRTRRLCVRDGRLKRGQRVARCRSGALWARAERNRTTRSPNHEGRIADGPNDHQPDRKEKANDEAEKR